LGFTLAIDFGSTFTKAAVFDLEKESLVGIAKAATTVDTDIMDGLKDALSRLREAVGSEEIPIERVYSSSSAAGGLRMVVAGLVSELTTKAAREAALGAGAKIVGAYSHGVSPDDLSRIEETAPDLILLTGGTDGGNEQVILHNAALLAKSRLDVPVIISGNKMAAREAFMYFQEAGKYAVITENVLPDLTRMNIEPVRTAIREIFMERITRAKGLEKAQEFVGKAIIPTPLAILKGAALLSLGIDGEEKGLGELVVVDVGGATTDVSSIASGHFPLSNAMVKGLPEPFEKRTVEGDLGIRYNAQSILEVAGSSLVLEKMQSENNQPPDREQLEKSVELLTRDVNKVPQNDEDFLIDIGLASAAVDIATRRHAGTFEEVYYPAGKVRIQYGKDLTGVKTIIGTGGIFAYGRNPGNILKSACFNLRYPESLRPLEPDFFVDEFYILYAVGLLAEDSPLQALRIMKKYLRKA